MSDDREVGYGKPPKQTQFPPGRSGNPTGKRKGTKNISTWFKDVMNEKITVVEGGKTRTMTKGEALIRTILNRALGGDPKAIGAIVSLAKLTGEFEVPPENKMRPGGVLRTGGVLLLGPAESPEEWERKTAEQQRPYREAPSPDVKKPGSDDPTKN